MIGIGGTAALRHRPSACTQAFAFTAPSGFVNPTTCIHVRLLGPCFKTGHSFHRPTRRGIASRTRQAVLAIQAGQRPVGHQSQDTPGADAEAQTSPRAFGPGPTVLVVTPAGDAPERRADTPTPGHC